MDPICFVIYQDHLINVAEVRTVSPIPSSDGGVRGLHIDYRHGGFTDMPGGSTNELLALMQEAQRAMAPF